MIDGRERTGGRDRREKRGERERDTKGTRDVSVIGSGGKKDVKDGKGRTDGRGKSERIGVRDTMRGGEGRKHFESGEEILQISTVIETTVQSPESKLGIRHLISKPERGNLCAIFKEAS